MLSEKSKCTVIHKGGYKMNRNPLIPFALIIVFGIGLMVAFSFIGLDNMKEMAEEKEGGGQKTEDVANAKPEDIFKQSCASCHGQNFEGGAGPSLKGVGDKLSVDEIKETIKNGRGAMPSGLVPEEKLDEMAEWVSKIK
jgi:cytochrome c550